MFLPLATRVSIVVFRKNFHSLTARKFSILRRIFSVEYSVDSWKTHVSLTTYHFNVFMWTFNCSLCGEFNVFFWVMTCFLRFISSQPIISVGPEPISKMKQRHVFVSTNNSHMRSVLCGNFYIFFPIHFDCVLNTQTNKIFRSKNFNRLHQKNIYIYWSWLCWFSKKPLSRDKNSSYAHCKNLNFPFGQSRKLRLIAILSMWMFFFSILTLKWTKEHPWVGAVTIRQAFWFQGNLLISLPLSFRSIHRDLTSIVLTMHQ